MKEIISLILRFFGWIWCRLKGGRVDLSAWMYWTDAKVLDQIKQDASEEQYFVRDCLPIYEWDPYHVWHESCVDDKTKEWDRQLAEILKEYDWHVYQGLFERHSWTSSISDERISIAEEIVKRK